MKYTSNVINHDVSPIRDEELTWEGAIKSFKSVSCKTPLKFETIIDTKNKKDNFILK